MMDNDASTVIGGTVSGNTASGGGAFYIDLAPWTGAHLHGVVIAGNHAWIGGGLMITGNFMPIDLANLTIVDNDAANIGGGMLVQGSEYHLVHSLVARNVAKSGGAIYHNVADPYTDPCPCPMTTTVGTVEFSVLVGNRLTNGSGAQIYAATDGLTVENSIISGHTGTAVVATAPVTFRYSDVSPGTFSGMASPVGANGNLAVDPGFVDAAHDNYHLAAGSPAIDAADPALTDGNGSRADMGLYGNVH
jgi:hypothetical protein